MRIEQDLDQYSLPERLLRPLRASLDYLRQIKLNETGLLILSGAIVGAFVAGREVGPSAFVIGAVAGGLVGLAIARSKSKNINKVG